MVTDDPDLPIKYKAAVTDPTVNYGKIGEMFPPFYYHWVSTGNTKARDIMVKFADFQYRFGHVNNVFNRENKANLAAFALAYRNDPAGRDVYKKYCTEWVVRAPHFMTILPDKGISYSDFAHTTQPTWNNDTIDEQDAITIGLPLAMAVAYPHQDTTPAVPFIDKPYSTYRTFAAIDRTSTEEGYVELYVNNDGDAGWTPSSSVKLFDPAEALVPTTIATAPGARHKRVIEPELALNAIPLRSAGERVRIRLRDLVRPLRFHALLSPERAGRAYGHLPPGGRR